MCPELLFPVDAIKVTLCEISALLASPRHCVHGKRGEAEEDRNFEKSGSPSAPAFCNGVYEFVLLESV